MTGEIPDYILEQLREAEDETVDKEEVIAELRAGGVGETND